MKKAAFTLIELLVVIAIIAVLASISLPVFQRVQEKARATQDAANLKQIGIATIAYLNDNDEITPGSASDWVRELNEDLGGTTDSSTDTPTVSSLGKVFLSPFDKRNISENPVSYGYNEAALNLDFGNVKSASRFILMAPSPNSDPGDSLNFDGTAANPANIDGSALGADPPLGTHANRGQINVLFGDSHVESMKWSAYVGDSDSAQWLPDGT